MSSKTLLPLLGLGLLTAGAAAQGLPPVGVPTDAPFQRIATFPIFENSQIDTETVAEIVAATDDGMTLVYTDSELEVLGFVDITNPHAPVAAGTVVLPGDPTSVAVLGQYALVCVDTSADFVNTSGDLVVIDIPTQTVVHSLPLGGQPDAIAVSPDKRFAAIAIENERDEDLGTGEPVQLPAGFVVIVDLPGAPAQWSTRTVSLAGVPDLFPSDPEPEFVDISALNVCVVTMQENNHIALIDLPSGTILDDFPARDVDLTQVDTSEDDKIDQDASLADVSREPDAVAWTSDWTFATADEGDLYGGSRGFTTFAYWGKVLYSAGSTIEHEVARLGHYPEARSENKGNEPEGVEFGDFGSDKYLFVGSERANLVLVYQLFVSPFFGNTFPVYRQALPTGVAPEGLIAIPSRDLFVVACEKDDRGDKLRSSIMIYERAATSAYPTIVSNDRADRSPIPWAALSGLAIDPASDDKLYTVHDSFYRQSRFYSVDRSSMPATIRRETVLTDTTSKLRSALDGLKASLPATATADFDVDALVEADGTVNLDLEGITSLADGTFWLAHEGAGNLVAGVSDPADRPFESPDLLLHVDAAGSILDVALLPQTVTESQLRFGFEGLAYEGGAVYVAFQRAWQDAGDAANLARIGRYDTVTGAWTFAHYPLDAPASANGGWVGMGDLVALGDGKFAALERDNQGGPDAAVKRVYSFDVTGVTFLDATQVAAFPVLTKTLDVDLLVAGTFAPFGGFVPEKVEGLAVTSDGTALIVNDNDGVDDNSGETLLIELSDLF